MHQHAGDMCFVDDTVQLGLRRPSWDLGCEHCLARSSVAAPSARTTSQQLETIFQSMSHRADHCLRVLTIACWSVCFGCSTQTCFSLMQVQYALGYASAAYSVLLGLGMIFLEIVCLKGDLNCDLLSVSRSAAI